MVLLCLLAVAAVVVGVRAVGRRGDLLGWFARIPASDWWRYAPRIAIAYGVVYVCVSHLSMVFTANEEQFANLVPHPLTAFFFAALVTVVLQTSFITEFAVIFAAAGFVSLPVAVALVLGGNLGTGIINTLVAFLHVRNRPQFRLAFAAALVHDLFNLFLVYLVLPAELTSGFFSTHVRDVALALGSSDATPGPAAAVPMTDAGHATQTVVAILGMIGGILLIVISLKRLFIDRVAASLSAVVFGSRARSAAYGLGITCLLQNSSLSTSIVVPAVGHGTIPLRRAFDYQLGCNLGSAVVTTVFTLPVILSGSINGTAVALCQLVFNLYGVVLFLIFPSLGDAICLLAQAISDRTLMWSRARLALTLAGVYYVLPAIGFALCLWWHP